MGHYRLIFRGKLQDSTGRAEAIARLATALKITEDVVERSFFRQWPKTVFESDDRAKVDNIRRIFHRAGAELELLETAQSTPPEAAPPTSAAASAPSSAPPSAPPSAPSSTRPSRRAPLWAGAALVLCAAVGLAAWYTLPLWHHEESPQLPALEAALAQQDLLLLAHVDVHRAAELEKRYLGSDDSALVPAAGSGDLFGDLMRAGVDPREAVDLALVGAYPGDDGFAIAGVLQGHFDRERVQRFLRTHYELLPPVDGDSAIRVRTAPASSCQQARIFAVDITPQRIVFAPPQRLAPLLQRLQQQAEAEIPLQAWRDFRGTRIASVGIFAPKSAAKGVHGIAGMMLSGASGDLAAIEAGYLGVQASVAPPGLVLSAAASSSDGDFLDRKQAALDSALAEVRSKLDQRLPELARLFERVSVFRRHNQLGAEVSLDRHFSDDIRRAVDAALTGLFASTDIKLAGASAPTEQIDKDAAKFDRQYDPAQLPSFADSPGLADAPSAWSDGPFALGVESIGVADTGAPFVELQARARGLQNMADDGHTARVIVADALDAAGQSLLDTPGCGSDKNRQAADFGSASSGSLYNNGEATDYRENRATKKIQLRSGARLDQVAQIRGAIELLQPVETIDKVVHAPFAGKSLEFGGARVAFGEIEAGSLSYRSSGDTGQILAVRALNAKGQVLRRAGGSSFGPVLGGSRLHNARYYGVPQTMQVTFAKATQKIRYPFELRNIYPQPRSTSYSPPFATHAAEPGQLQQALQASVPAKKDSDYFSPPLGRAQAGPLRLALTQLQVSRALGLMAQFDLRAPLLPGLEHNLSGASLEVDTVVNASGEEQPLQTTQKFALTRPGWLFNGKWQNNADYLEAQTGLQQLHYDGGRPQSLKGSITLHFPLALQQRRIDTIEYGKTYSIDGVQLVPKALGRRDLSLQLGGETGRLAAIEVLDADGKRISGQASLYDTRDGHSTVRVSIGGVPHTLVIHMVEKSTTRKYPFEVALNG
ncbi:hypothetical protein [Microbulbifer sp. SAOS-129_SWC]|uniref:hypothetical protein n=1 Tax=Microbulbifer sp. SAOS-129_SWC TaxID=3145235 RepID=UPI003217C792